MNRRQYHLLSPILATLVFLSPSFAQEFSPSYAQEGGGPPATDFSIGGQYRIMGNASNFGFHSTTLRPNQETTSFVNQRFRTWFGVKQGDEVEAYLQLEMGHQTWGDNYEWTKTYSGPRHPGSTDPNGDRVGMEVRRAWISYRPEPGRAWRVGIQDWQDSFRQTLASSVWDFQAGGVRYESASADSVLSLGGFSLWEGNPASSDDALLLALDWQQTASPDAGFGASVYFIHDRSGYSYPTSAPYDSSWDLWVGGRYRWTGDHNRWDAFLIGNPGSRDDGTGTSFDHLGFAGGLQVADWQFGDGKFDCQILAATGEDDPASRNSGEFRTIAQSERDGFGAQGYWSYLVVTSPHGPSDVADLGVGLQNRGMGLLTIQARWRTGLGDSLSSATSIGWLRTAADSSLVVSPDIGVEIAETLTWDLGGGLAFDLGAGYLFTGDYFRIVGAGAPDDLWEVFTRFQLEF